MFRDTVYNLMVYFNLVVTKIINVIIDVSAYLNEDMLELLCLSGHLFH